MSNGTGVTRKSVNVSSGATARTALRLSAPNACQMQQPILFATASSFVRPTLGNKAALLNLIGRLQNPGTLTHLLIAGHTDSVGSASDNMALSERRVQNVQAVLQGNTGYWNNFFRSSGQGGETWGTSELTSMVIETGEATPSNAASVVTRYQGPANQSARTGLFQRYFARLLSSNTIPSITATNPPWLAYGEEQLLRGSRLSPSKDSSLPPIRGDFEPNRRVESFFMRSASVVRSQYPRWMTRCSLGPPPPAVTVTIASVTIIGKNQTTDIQLTVNPSPLPRGTSVTLTLGTTSGTGEARFTSTNSTSMTITQSGLVTVRGVIESSTVDNIRLTARITGQTGILAQEDFTVLLVRIASLDFIGKAHTIGVQVTLTPAPLPAGSSVTLELSTISGTGQAVFGATNTTTTTITNSSNVQIRGVTESSAVDNIRLTARITGQTGILAQEDFTVLFVEVAEIDFQSGIDIYNAATNAIIPATGPEWRRAPPRNHPTAYVRTGGGSGLARGLRISATAVSGFSGTLALRAVGPSGSNVEIGQINVTFSGGTASNIAMQFTTLPNTVKRLNNINLQWQYQHSSWPSFADANTSMHTLYIIDATPVTGVRAYTELLDCSCQWADGQSGALNVFNGIWARMQAQATGWTYYGPGPRGNTTRLLITRHNGDCDAWAHFTADCCRVHGISANHYRIRPGIRVPPATRYDGIVVNNVTYGTVFQVGPPRKTFRHTISSLGITGLNRSPTGIPGQGMATPGAKVFNWHAVVIYGGTYYDPSYMVTWASEPVFRNALAGQLENRVVEWPTGSGNLYSVVLVVQPPYP